MVSPKDLGEQCGVIYECACDVCGELQLGETGRSLVERVYEHAKSIERQDSMSALSQYQEQSGYRWNNNPIIDKIKVLDKEPRDIHSKFLEVVYIKLRGATLNRKDGYDLLELYLPLLREDIQ